MQYTEETEYKLQCLLNILKMDFDIDDLMYSIFENDTINNKYKKLIFTLLKLRNHKKRDMIYDFADDICVNYDSYDIRSHFTTMFELCVLMDIIE